jgi:hypothetical protein
MQRDMTLLPSFGLLGPQGVPGSRWVRGRLLGNVGKLEHDVAPEKCALLQKKARFISSHATEGRIGTVSSHAAAESVGETDSAAKGTGLRLSVPRDTTKVARSPDSASADFRHEKWSERK